MIEYKRCYANRPYHNISHINQVLDAITKIQPVTDRQHIAVIYHDIVYDPWSSMNEELSATIAAVDYPEHAKFLTDAILATKGHVATGCAEIDLILDADMSILAASEDEYNNYVKAIRREYFMYSDDEFRVGRKNFLESFDGFITPQFQIYDQLAYANIERELRCL